METIRDQLAAIDAKYGKDAEVVACCTRCVIGTGKLRVASGYHRDWHPSLTYGWALLPDGIKSCTTLLDPRSCRMTGDGSGYRVYERIVDAVQRTARSPLYSLCRVAANGAAGNGILVSVHVIAGPFNEVILSTINTATGNEFKTLVDAGKFISSIPWADHQEWKVKGKLENQLMRALNMPWALSPYHP